ncbi:SDR family NAD(P)-dependent oxidoreductase [Pseudoduganella violacea]|uniref:3-oxoacyl-[acyl-carrier protein] reductase n=1 Tax=Pseudoduganella violacea TaxID=1715466 RepID=A0A7W5B9U3_9BURK|nr:SDR family NAD(P)-dependent oxidoreductase [Pseudoduganella violacea]MBB3119222.1 3-oxoacyl-[acyl-carrier protein] reductase [Pseudoduganella violacea]
MSSPIPVYPDLQGKVALVTGGSRGIGAAACLALARCGAKVAVNGRDGDAIDATVAAIREQDGAAFAAPADCSSLAAVQAMRAAIEDHFGAPELLLAFAGGGSGRPMPLAEITEEDWRSSIDHNLTSTFFTLKCFLPAMIARGHGSIVTMASAGGRVASGAPAGYGAAKAGVIMLTRHAANEVGRQGIRVNCISPSAVLTERTAQRMPPAQQQAMLGAFPLGRLGQPDDIASAALFLLSESSSWITGITLDVAGGRVMN